MVNFKALVFITASCSFVESYCPPGWDSHGSSCYHFSHDDEQWIGAVDICRELGGELVKIDDADENNYLADRARRRGVSFWIGLSDLGKEGTYVWAETKTSLSSGDFSYWHRGQPDNGGGDENCVNLEDTQGMQWNDVPCDDHQNYICERSNVDTDIVG